MKQLGTCYIETERLILRPFEVEDAPFMYRNWARDPEVTKFLTWPAHAAPAVSEKYIKEKLSEYGRSDFYDWAIVLKELGEPIGEISVAHSNFGIGMVHLGYCIGKKWWHRGITPEALSALIEFFMEAVGTNRIELFHDPNNPNSGAVMRKCGLKYEGTMRKSGRNNQGICDNCVYAILKEDYEEMKHGIVAP